MAFSLSRILTLFLAVLLHVAQADHNEEVHYAVDILSSIGPSLAVPFCTDYINYQTPTETCYVTLPAYTFTSTRDPKPCEASATPTSYGGETSKPYPETEYSGTTGMSKNGPNSVGPKSSDFSFKVSLTRTRHLHLQAMQPTAAG